MVSRFKHGDDQNGDSKRKRRFEETPSSGDTKSKVKKESKEENDVKEVKSELSTTPVTPATIKDIMAQAKNFIEEKKKQLNVRTL